MELLKGGTNSQAQVYLVDRQSKGHIRNGTIATQKGMANQVQQLWQRQPLHTRFVQDRNRVRHRRFKNTQY